MSDFVSMYEDTSGDIPQLCPEENSVSTTLMEKELYDIILQMKNNKLQSPNAFIVEFIEGVGRQLSVI